MTTDTEHTRTVAWAEHALRHVAEHGLAALDLDAVAASAGVPADELRTVFGDTRGLLEAALQRWEEVVSELGRDGFGPNPREGLARFVSARLDAGLDGDIDIAMLAHGGDPLVIETARRVTEHRLDALSALIQQLGVPPHMSRARAYGALASYLGLFHLQRVTGERLRDHEVRGHIKRTIDAMVTI